MDSSLKTEEIAADPFAADIFAAGGAANEPSAEENEREKANLWSANLPAAQPAATDWNRLLDNLAADFSGKLVLESADSLARLLNLPEDSPIEFAALTKREINAAEDFTAADERNSFWLTIAVETGAAEIYLAIDNVFAVSLVDAALGEAAAQTGQIRNLTRSETAVIEFLGLNLTHEVNLILQTPLFKFRSLSREIPVLLQQKIGAPYPSLLACDWQIVHERLPAVVRLYLAPESLQALQTDENRLLDNRLREAARRSLQNKIENVRMRVRCGAAELSLGELASLESGDIILLENHNFAAVDANLYGSAEIFLGDGENARIVGQIAGGDSFFGASSEENANPENGKTLVRGLNSKHGWQLTIEYLTEIENPVSFEKSMAETVENLTDEAADTDENFSQSNGLAVENLAVTLRVELEARRLTVAEIANLRENQVLELGVRPTDAVNILIDNQTVGRGELVTVEGRLGVRITKLLR